MKFLDVVFCHQANISRKIFKFVKNIICYFFFPSILGHQHSSLCGLFTSCLHKISRRVCSVSISNPINLGQLSSAVCRLWAGTIRHAIPLRLSAWFTGKDLNFFFFHQSMCGINVCTFKKNIECSFFTPGYECHPSNTWS